MRDFSKDYVLEVTFKHMNRAVDISMNKTVERLPELENKNNNDVLETLSELSNMKRFLAEYEKRVLGE